MARFVILVVLASTVLAAGHVSVGATPAVERARAAARPHAASRITEVQARLVALRYLAPTAVSGQWDDATRQAVIAFQSWEGLQRDGVVGLATLSRLATARRPVAPPGRGSRIQIDLTRQLALLVRGNDVVRAIHVSTGAAGTPTPAGSFRVYRKERESWSLPYRVWLPWASYFAGGVAVHGYRDVPAYPASHGCVRIPLSEARAVYAFARLGTPVSVAETPPVPAST